MVRHCRQARHRSTPTSAVPAGGGPCPPVGHKPHRYNFTLHALKVDKLDLPQGATAALAGYMINANSLGKAKLTGIYGRRSNGKSRCCKLPLRQRPPYANCCEPWHHGSTAPTAEALMRCVTQPTC